MRRTVIIAGIRDGDILLHLAMMFLKSRMVALLLAVAGMTQANAQQTTTKTNDVVVVPLSYNMDGYNDLGSVKTGRLKKQKQSAGFRQQLDAVRAKTAALGGNIFQITRIEDAKQKGRYRFWGEAYSTGDIARLRERIAEAQKKQAPDASCAYLAIYRPAYMQGFNDSTVYDIVVNDTLHLEMKNNTKYVLKMTNAGAVKLDVKHKNFEQHITVDVKMGESYYVRNYVSFPHSHTYITAGDYKVKLRGYTPYLDKIDNYQGAIESSMVTQIVIGKKL